MKTNTLHGQGIASEVRFMAIAGLLAVCYSLPIMWCNGMR